MEWSQESATNAYLDTIKLCNKHDEESDSSKATEPKSNEYISALAAGMSAKLIVEVTPVVSPSTIALAAAARQTGGRVVCITPEPMLDESQRVIEESGLNDMVEYRTGDPVELLRSYEKIDFSLVDCKTDDYSRVLDVLDFNPNRSVVVTNNLGEGKEGLVGHLDGVEVKTRVRSMKHSIGKGMEITMIGPKCGGTTEIGKRSRSTRGGGGGHSKAEKRGGGVVKKTDKSKWIFEVDEKSGEEHIFRMPRSL